MYSFYQDIYEESKKRAKHTVWIMSDLQQGLPENTRRCLEISMNDYHKLGCPAEQIWYLGDAVEGSDEERVSAMCQLQEDAFGSLGIPLCYALGNHDFDYACKDSERRPPLFWQMVHNHAGWHTNEKIEDFYFRTTVGDWPVYFLSDHMSLTDGWFTTHGWVRTHEEQYPYTQADYRNMVKKMEEENHSVITASHYSFPGGNRESHMLQAFMPLPQNERIHFYGHAHIGDWRWADYQAFRRISWIDNHDIPQINVSSFENIRGKHCRSVILHLYDDRSMGIFFRNHDDGVFTEVYFPMPENAPHRPISDLR